MNEKRCQAETWRAGKMARHRAGASWEAGCQYPTTRAAPCQRGLPVRHGLAIGESARALGDAKSHNTRARVPMA
jgi:hypothetical protein